MSDEQPINGKDLLMKMISEQKASQPMLPVLGPIPPGLVPQPAPISINTANVTGSDEKNYVVLQIATPSGVMFYFLPCDVAQRVGEGIIKAATAGAAGLVIQ